MSEVCITADELDMAIVRIERDNPGNEMWTVREIASAWGCTLEAVRNFLKRNTHRCRHTLAVSSRAAWTGSNFGSKTAKTYAVVVGGHYAVPRREHFRSGYDTRCQDGELNPQAVLTEHSVRAMRKLREETNLSYQDVAGYFTVSRSCAHDAITGNTWSHVK